MDDGDGDCDGALWRCDAVGSQSSRAPLKLCDISSSPDHHSLSTKPTVRYGNSYLLTDVNSGRAPLILCDT